MTQLMMPSSNFVEEAKEATRLTKVPVARCASETAGKATVV